MCSVAATGSFLVVMYPLYSNYCLWLRIQKLPGHSKIVTRASDCGSNVQVNVRHSVYCIPGSTLKFATATCLSSLAGKTMLFEPLETGLPAGLFASPSLMQVNGGTVLVHVVNVGTVDVVLYPTTVIGKFREVYLVGLPIGLTVVSSVTTQVTSCGVSTASEQIKSVNLGGLSVEKQE